MTSPLNADLMAAWVSWHAALCMLINFVFVNLAVSGYMGARIGHTAKRTRVRGRLFVSVC